MYPSTGRQSDNQVNMCGLTGTRLVSGMSNWNWIGSSICQIKLDWFLECKTRAGMVKTESILGRIQLVFFHIFATRDGPGWNWTGNPNHCLILNLDRQSTSLIVNLPKHRSAVHKLDRQSTSLILNLPNYRFRSPLSKT